VSDAKRREGRRNGSKEATAYQSLYHLDGESLGLWTDRQDSRDPSWGVLYRHLYFSLQEDGKEATTIKTKVSIG
jgi:hypothetical protein